MTIFPYYLLSKRVCALDQLQKKVLFVVMAQQYVAGNSTDYMCFRNIIKISKQVLCNEQHFVKKTLHTVNNCEKFSTRN